MVVKSGRFNAAKHDIAETRREEKMNVSKEADAAFMKELKGTDPERYHNLIRNMERSVASCRRNLSLAHRIKLSQAGKSRTAKIVAVAD
jgi:hypothetical protein